MNISGIHFNRGVVGDKVASPNKNSVKSVKPKNYLLTIHGNTEVSSEIAKGSETP